MWIPPPLPHTHTLADKLFQMIVRETEISSSSSAYGLRPVKKNGVPPATNCSNNPPIPEPQQTSVVSSKKMD